MSQTDAAPPLPLKQETAAPQSVSESSASPSSSSASSSTETSSSLSSNPAVETVALDEFLASESLTDKLTAVDRVLSSFLLDPFDTLGLSCSAAQDAINRQYRSLSLLVHPDKIAAEHRDRAQQAFARLSEARAALLDSEKRGQLDELVSQARQTVITAREKDSKEKRQASASAAAGSAVLSSAGYDATQDPDFEAAVSSALHELLIDREWRRRQVLKATSASEGREDAEREARKREREEKAKEEAEYETKRGDRVNSWRSFLQGSNGKQKKKQKIGMMAPPRTTQHDNTHSYVRRVA